MSTKIVCISDTHNQHNKVIIPECDLIIHAGDCGSMGNPAEFIKFNKWAARQKVPVIYVAGNHCIGLQKYPSFAESLLKDVIYLRDSSYVFNGIKIHGSPWTPIFGSWAFMDEDENLTKYWDLIPEDTDILVSHGPAYGILDRIPSNYRTPGEELNVGSKTLLERIKKLNLKYHIFGHIHHSHGTYNDGKTIFVNASICTEEYKPLNPPIVIEV